MCLLADGCHQVQSYFLLPTPATQRLQRLSLDIPGICFWVVFIYRVVEELVSTEILPAIWLALLWVAESFIHPGPNSPVSPSTGQHLVDADDVEGVEPHSDVKAIFATAFHHVLVGTNTGSLQG